jgi:uncharacterized protein YfaS (alpha-2-macroglobulin family)
MPPRVLTAVLFALVALVPPAPLPTPAQPAEPRVARFSPQGTQKRVRQVQATFSRPMVPIGDPRPGADPFEIACPERGAGRWLDALTWVFDFDRELPGGVRCSFRLSAGLRALDGGAVAGPREFAFSTGGPAIRSSAPHPDRGPIDEEQAFVLALDAPVTEASVLQGAGFSVEGLRERVGVRILSGSARDAILAARFGDSPRPEQLLVLQARQRFPNGRQVTLVWGRGVESASGVATDQNQELTWTVRPAFTVDFRCGRESPRSACVPVMPMTLEFSAPLAAAEARRIALVAPDGRRLAPAGGPDEEGPLVSRLTFKGPFPENATLQVQVPRDLSDEAGRRPVNASSYPLGVRTGPFPPLAKFSARFGVLERNADPALPVTVRNLEPEVAARLLGVPASPDGFLEWVQGRLFRAPVDRAGDVLPWLQRLAAADRERSVFGPPAPPDGPGRTREGARSSEATAAPPTPPLARPTRTFKLPRPRGGEAMEVIGIPLRQPGFYVIELESARLGAALLGQNRPMYVPAAALVTNLAVHLKRGTGASLVWVTTLDEARPVAGAQVAVHDCRGQVLWRGRTEAGGIARPGDLPPDAELPRCGERYTEDLGNLDGGLFVTAQTADDMSFVHSSWSRGIESWRFNLPMSDAQGPLSAHTVFDRALLRAGDTVHMKHVLRVQTPTGLALPPAGQWPSQLAIRHVGSDDRYELSVEWDRSGVAETAWQIPREAKLGTYTVMMDQPAAGAGPARRFAGTLVSGRFRVQEFRVPLMRARLSAPAEPLVAATELPLDMSVEYLAGGGAGRLPVTLRAQVQPGAAPAFELFEGFAFATGALREGTARRDAGPAEGPGEMLDDDDGEESGEGSAARTTSQAVRAVHQREDLVLDGAGTARAVIARLPRVPAVQHVLAELEYRDPNGEAQTASTRVTLWPGNRLAGIRVDSWVASRESVKVTAAVADLTGRPVAGAPVEVDLYERRFYSHRKRLVGGFYAYEHVEEITRLGPMCRGVTDTRGRLACDARAPVSGNVVVQVTSRDGAGRATAATAEVWVAGSGDWWFGDARDSDRIDLLPERGRYEPGQTARLQVRMPFRAATALVTVEREGVLDAFVTPLSGQEPVIEVPLRDQHAPNVFVSALVVRGRVGGTQPGALVDLGRPAHKLGIAEVRVGWRAHELRVTVSTDRTVYRVRERALARINVRTATGAPLPRGSEVALAAVDEGLLELAPNPSVGLLEAMMRRRPYGMATATAEMFVVGRRHFGLKAVPQGGGGGLVPTRQLFDTLLLWRARVPLTERGDALVEIPLNDSLTSFRIVAVATAGAELFGTGTASIRATQDLMILPGLSPLVREGDRFRAEVTLRNTTGRPMAVALRAQVAGVTPPPEPREVTLAAGESRAVGWEVTAPPGVSALAWEIGASVAGGAADRVRVTQQVMPAVPEHTVQATLTQWDGSLRQPVERPAGALPGRGGVRVGLTPRLGDGVSPMREWMADYPYTCLEQQVSRAVVLRDEAMWRALAASMPSFADGDGLLKYFARMEQGSEVLTAYVLAVSHESGWSLPPDVAKKAQAGLRRFVTGSLVRRPEMSAADLGLRKLAAIEALARYGQAGPELIGAVAIEPNLWPTSAVLDWWSVLDRMPGAARRTERLREVEQVVQTRLTLTGTAMGFSTEARDGLGWLMVSPDTNAVRLVLHLIGSGRWKDEVPRLARAAIARQRAGRWDLTVANAWGALALERFSAAYERAPVSGITAVSLGDQTRRLDWAGAPRGGAVSLPWPPGRADLAVDHGGGGRPWVLVEARASVPLRSALASGYRIVRTATPIEPRQAGALSRGDLLRVRLEVEAQSDMTWVVVNDPIPAGASHLGTGLGGQSRLATQGERASGQAWPAFEERRLDSFRAYYSFVPKGRFSIEYTIRLNQSGRFLMPPTRVEALYAPDVHGELPIAPVEVQP